MALPSQRDPAETGGRLRQWLASRLDGATDVEVSEVGGPAYTGYSHETLMFEAGWDDHGRAHRRPLVARVEPSSHSIFFAQDVALEMRVMRAMGDAGVLVPSVHWHEEDPSWLGAPFVVMDRVDGLIPADNPPYTFGGWLLESSPDQQASVFWSGLEAMAAVHRVDPETPGLEAIARPRGAPGADAEIAYLDDYIERVCGSARPKTLRRALEWLDANRPRSHEPVGVCWGDSRIGNQIFADHRCVALLDWEMATIGNPEMDLAWFLVFDRLFSEGLAAPRPPGFPGHADAIARYQELTGIPVRNVEYYQVMGAMRFAAILMRLGQLMIMTGVLPEDSDFGEKSFAMDFTAKLLDEREGAA